MKRTNKGNHSTRIQVSNLSKLIAKPKCSQQEMVGFALIVILVVIAGMIFLIISAKKPVVDLESNEISNLQASLMSYTTDCAISFIPQYSSVEELILSCYNSERCTNLNKNSCEYLNESLRNIMKEIMKSENSASAYELSVFYKDSSNETENLIEPIRDNNCSGRVLAAPLKVITSGSVKIYTRLRFCYE